MALLPIYLYGTEVLKKEAQRIIEITDADVALVQNMFETMHEANGIGLAANQIGLLKQILVVDISDTEAGKGTKPLLVINPEIVDEEGEVEFEEGCLSIPDIREKVWRPESIRLRFQDINLKVHEKDFDGLFSRVLQHEIDHLNGILFTDYLSGTKKTLLKSRLKKISKGDIETSYEVVPVETKPKTKSAKSKRK